MQQYIDLVNRVLKTGIDKSDRTGTGTRSVFGHMMRFNLQDGFPLVTTKKVKFDSIVHELLWMLRGQTNIQYLVKNKVNIWNDWPYKYYCQCQKDPLYDMPELTETEFAQRIATDDRFAKDWGDCGPIYGKQWREWETHRSRTFGEEAIDQIDLALGMLRNNPDSRRIIVNAWNPAKIEEMAKSGLPPCHLMFQFYTRELTIQQRMNLVEFDITAMVGYTVKEITKLLDVKNAPKRYLDCSVLIRSNDLGLGAPYNIAQYALLTHIMAECVNMVPGELVYTNIGDAHIYSNHIEQMQMQVQREPRPLPKLEIKHGASRVTDPADFMPEQFSLVGYDPHPAIYLPIAV